MNRHLTDERCPLDVLRHDVLYGFVLELLDHALQDEREDLLLGQHLLRRLVISDIAIAVQRFFRYAPAPACLSISILLGFAEIDNSAKNPASQWPTGFCIVRTVRSD